MTLDTLMGLSLLLLAVVAVWDWLDRREHKDDQ